MSQNDVKMMSMSLHVVIEPPTINILLNFRTVASASDSAPTIKPGQSMSETIGRSCA